MFKPKKKKKRRKIKKIPANTDGDMLPEDMVRQVEEVARQVGRSATKEIENNPELMAAFQREMAAAKEPGPEDVLLLFIYGRGATTPEKAIPIPVGEETETLMLYLYSDGYLSSAGNNIYINILGMQRLRLIGAIDDKGQILSPYKQGEDTKESKRRRRLL